MTAATLVFRKHPNRAFDGQMAKIVFPNGWTASVIRGQDANADEDSVEIAAINPEGEIVYGLGTVEIGGEAYDSTDVYSFVLYEHIDAVLSIIAKQ